MRRSHSRADVDCSGQDPITQLPTSALAARAVVVHVGLEMCCGRLDAPLMGSCKILEGPLDAHGMSIWDTTPPKRPMLVSAIPMQQQHIEMPPNVEFSSQRPLSKRAGNHYIHR